ncbi:MAG: hypothetical protein WD037_06420 [Balneolales bacterium]
MNFLAIIDYEHLDNAIFLKSFSEAIAEQQGTRGIILHGDSQYTDRLIQTGMMSDDARQRSIKDLNHRLIALMADSGVAAVGMNGYQRNMISYDGTTLDLDTNLLVKFPVRTHLLLSNLIEDNRTQKPFAYDLANLASSLYRELDIDEVFIFSKNEADESLTDSSMPKMLRFRELDTEFKNTTLPEDLLGLNVPYRLATTRSFRKLPEVGDTVLITPD